MYSSDGERTMLICFSTLRNRPTLEYLNASAEGGGGEFLVETSNSKYDWFCLLNCPEKNRDPTLIPV